eukprot:5364313-Amphidinium_carterae.2
MERLVPILQWEHLHQLPYGKESSCLSAWSFGLGHVIHQFSMSVRCAGALYAAGQSSNFPPYEGSGVPSTGTGIG